MLFIYESCSVLLIDVLSIILTFSTVRQVSKPILKNGNADFQMCQPLLIVPQSTAVMCMKLTF